MSSALLSLSAMTRTSPCVLPAEARDHQRRGEGGGRHRGGRGYRDPRHGRLARGGDLGGPRARREGHGGRGRSAASREELGQQVREILGLAVAHGVDEEPRPARRAADLVQALDPRLRRLQVPRLGRDDQERVEALDRDHANQPGQRAGGCRAEDLVQVEHERLHVGAAHGEDADGEARQPVDVEERDRVQEVAHLPLVAREDQEVANLVDANGVVGGEGLENPRHLLRADELHGNDDDREPLRQRLRVAAELGRYGAANRRDRQDLEDALLLHHRRVVLAQEHLERRQERGTREWA